MIPIIHDFQHKHMPERFSEDDLRIRDRVYNRLAKNGDPVLLVSKAVAVDFRRYMPQFAAKCHVFHMPSLYAFTDVPAIDTSVPSRYGLPSKFMLLSNQYWRHKNFAVVLEALGRLRSQGLIIPTAITGLPLDYRDAANSPTSEMLQGIAANGLASTVVPLGLIAREHLIQMMRCAALVIQPSLFEGWGLSVQESVALGRPVICSDIPALRENAPGALAFVDPNDAAALADTLGREWPGLLAGPDLEGERTALDAQRTFGRSQGESLWAMVGRR